MNRGFYCAVGVASGVFLLGGGVAEAGAAADGADRNIDTKAVRGLLADIFTPTGAQGRTGAQDRLAPSAVTPVERAGDATPDRAQGDAQPDTAKPLSARERHKGTSVTTDAGTARQELLPGLGDNNSADGLSLLLNGLPGGRLLGKLTTPESPLGELINRGPLGTLMGGLKADSTAGGSPSGAGTVDTPKTKVPATRGNDTTGWPQPAPVNPAGPDDTTTRPVAPNPSTTQQANDIMARGTVAREEPVPGASNGEEGLVERQPPVSGTPLIGGMFGPYGPLGQVELLGGDTLRGVPVVGELVGEGVSLKTLNHVPALGDVVNQIWTPNARQTTLPALGNLPTISELSQVLIGGQQAGGPAEAVSAPRYGAVVSSPRHVAEPRALAQHATDKAKVTPQLQALFGPDSMGSHALSGIFHQLPLAGELP